MTGAAGPPEKARHAGRNQAAKENGMNILIVSRHPALTEYILELGLADDHTDVLTHVDSPEQVRGRDVIGILPMWLAAEANSVTEIPIRHTLETRAQAAKGDLTLEQLRELAGEPMTYRVTKPISGPAPERKERRAIADYIARVRAYCQEYFLSDAVVMRWQGACMQAHNAYDACVDAFCHATGLAITEPYSVGSVPSGEWRAELDELVRRLHSHPLPPGSRIANVMVGSARGVAVLTFDGLPRVTTSVPLCLRKL